MRNVAHSWWSCLVKRWTYYCVCLSVCVLVSVWVCFLFYFVLLFLFFAFYKSCFLFWPILPRGFFAVYVCFSLFIYILAGQPGVARAFALRAELYYLSFLASRSLNPEMNCSPKRKIAFLWNVLALTKRPFWIMFLPFTDREPLISTCGCALQVGV